jgi:hypothetical protein
MRIGFVSLLLLCGAAACGAVSATPDAGGGDDVDGAVSDGPMAPDAPNPVDAAGPDAMPMPMWVQVAEDSKIDSTQGGITAVGLDKTIYYAREGDTNVTVFRSYDTVSGNIGDENLMPAASDDFCACGYSGQLIAAAGRLWYFANYGQQYDPSTKAWSSATYPVVNQRGEAGWGTLQTSVGGITTDVIVGVGGRGPLSSVQGFNTPSQTWTALPAYPLSIDSSVVVGVGGTPYVFGGYTNAGSVQTAYKLTPGVGWQALPDVPAGVQVAGGSGVELAGRIYVLPYFGGQLQVLDLSQNTWLPGIPTPPNLQNPRLARADGQVWLVGVQDNGAGLGIFKLVLPQ